MESMDGLDSNSKSIFPSINPSTGTGKLPLCEEEVLEVSSVRELRAHSVIIQKSTSLEEMERIQQSFLEASSKMRTIDGSNCEKLIQHITTRISSGPLSNEVICKLSRACVPIITHPKVLPLVESLLLAQFEINVSSPGSYVLAEDFLTAVYKGIYESGVIQVSYSSKSRLWCIHFKSFQQEVDAFLEQLRDMSKKTTLCREAIRQSDVIRACQTYSHLRFYLCTSLQQLERTVYDWWTSLDIPLTSHMQ